jgi:phosphate transport system substrate-binding protein
MMKRPQRRFAVLFLLALFTMVGMTVAQDGTVTVAGSGIVAPVFDALSKASGATFTSSLAIAGTRDGFDKLCSGAADVAVANRAITTDENNNCTTNLIDYVELLVGQNVVTFIVAADAPYAQCLNQLEVNTLFAPSAQATNWNAVGTNTVDQALSVIIPPLNSPTFAVLDKLVEGDGVRSDAVSQGSDTDVVNAVVSTPGAIGIVSLSVASASDKVRTVQLNASDVTGCASPSVDNVVQRAYPAADPFFIYANKASLSKPGLTEVLTFAVSDAAPAIIEGLGFSAGTSQTYASSRDALTGNGSARPFSESITAFSIPSDAAGQVVIAGSPNLRDYLSALSSALTAGYQNLTFDIKLAGHVAGARRLCNGELDILATDSALSAEEEQNCAANNITTTAIDLGKQAVVLVANDANDLECLTNAQLTTLWSAASAGTVTNWNQVDAGFPDKELMLFAPRGGDASADLMLLKASGAPTPVREDLADTNSDPLYRAAATANVEGGLTVMSWADYQRVLANNQQRIHLVGVDGGSGCVVPSDETIADGSYTLSRGAQLLLNTQSLTKVQVQSFLWYIADDSSFSAMAQFDLIGVNFGSLPALRNNLQKWYLDAAVAAAAAPEATPEATAAPSG